VDDGALVHAQNEFSGKITVVSLCCLRKDALHHFRQQLFYVVSHQYS